MGVARGRKGRRRILGLLPQCVRGLATSWRWALHHPQPPMLGSILLVTLWGLWGYAQHAALFRITKVVLPPNSPLQLRRPLIGTNLWEVDLRRLAEELKQQQPWLKDVRVVRQLPSAIRIEPIARRPIAQVRVDRWYPVDREGFILPEGTRDPLERLVRFVGFERGGSTVKIGSENADERLHLALRVLEILQRALPVISTRVTEVNVTEVQQIRFLLDGDVEVRCGSETEFAAQLDRLRATLKVVARQPLAVQYIDVRFREPVIGPRTS